MLNVISRVRLVSLLALAACSTSHGAAEGEGDGSFDAAAPSVAPSGSTNAELDAAPSDVLDAEPVTQDASVVAPDAGNAGDASDANDAGDASASDGGDGFETHCDHAGGIYYVAPNGSDTATGSMATPWATLTHAATTVKPGDTVRMRGGTYTPTATQKLASVGTASSWICFEAAEGEAPVWNGSAISKNDLLYISGQYLVFSGARMTLATNDGINVVNASYVDIVNNTVDSSAQAAITIGPVVNMTATSYIRVHGNEVTNNGLAGGGAPGVSSGNWPAITRSFGANHVSFTSNVVHDNYGEGIDFILTDQGDATGNVSYDNYSVNLYLDNASNVTVSGNLLYWTNTNQAFRRKDNGNAPIGISLAEESEYPIHNLLTGDVLVSNVIVGCAAGIYYGTYGSNTGLVNAVIAGNTVYNSTNGVGAPFYVGASTGHSGNVVSDNIFVGGPVASPAPETDAGAVAFTYGHNLFFQDTNAAEMGGPGDVSADPAFVDPGSFAASGYELGPASPARAAGVTVKALAQDFSGGTRASPPDLGAW